MLIYKNRRCFRKKYYNSALNISSRFMKLVIYEILTLNGLLRNRSIKTLNFYCALLSQFTHFLIQILQPPGVKDTAVKIWRHMVQMAFFDMGDCVILDPFPAKIVQRNITM